jgi:hypothetical protein
MNHNSVCARNNEPRRHLPGARHTLPRGRCTATMKYQVPRSSTSKI